MFRRSVLPSSRRWRFGLVGLGLGLLLAVPRPGGACSICTAAMRDAPTLRQEAALPSARIVVVGTVHDARDVDGRAGPTSELHVTHVLRNDPFLAGKKVIRLNNYVPSNEKNPPRFLVFCDIFREKFDPFRGVPVRSEAGIDYAKKVLALDPRDTVGNLAFYFRYLEHPDREVASDAFIEFAKAGDRDVAQAASRFDPARLREWLRDDKTPPERLGVYALLLGLCGSEDDASFLRALLERSDERVAGAYAGILGGFTRLRPREGWELTQTLLRDSRKPVTVRLGAASILRFWHGWQPRESKDNLLRCLTVMLGQPDLADLAVEDLRLWQMWDLSRDVLSLYGKKGYDAPLMQQAILRYALTCNDAGCRAFLEERRRVEPDAVREVEDLLRLDK